MRVFFVIIAFFFACLCNTFAQGDKIIGCFGGTTAKAIRDAGLRLDIEAPVPGITSMSAAIDAWFAANQKK